MKSYKITVNGQSYDVTVEEQGAIPAASRAASPQAAESAPAPKGGSRFASAPPAPSALSATGVVQVKAPMPGTLLSFKVAAGQAVKRGEVILILEAMKMENEIAAPSDGIVTAICVSEGASVSAGDVLAEITR